MQRDEGAATGTFSYDFDRHEAWLTNIHARLNTTEAAVWIDPGLVRQLTPYQFKAAPSVTLDGFVQCANDKGTHLDIQVEAPEGMDYTFCRRTLSCPRSSGRCVHRGSPDRAEGCNGHAMRRARCEGGADISWPRFAGLHRAGGGEADGFREPDEALFQLQQLARDVEWAV